MSTEVEIENAAMCATDDVSRKCAAIHLAEIPQGFLVSLGQKLLVQLYKRLANSEYAELFVARRHGKVVGFIAISFDTKAFYLEFLRRDWFAAVTAVVPRIFSLKMLKKCVETLRYPFKKDWEESSDNQPRCEVLNFCVSSDQQGLGIGRTLFFAATKCLKENGLTRLRIVTGGDQFAAQHFYRAVGATEVGELEVHGGENSILFDYRIA